ncbi:MAG: abortive infection protein [Nitrososphaerales archaeon]
MVGKTKLKGVNYDAGSVMYFNWRPDFDPNTVSREIEIIKNDLHCNAIRITGLDIKRLIVATEIALKQGLEVWLLPTIWNKKQDQTLVYTQRVAESAEKLRREYPESLVFVVGGELTLFMQGIVEGKNVAERMTKLMAKFREEKQSKQGPTNVSESIPRIKAGEHNRLLDKFLQKVSVSVRQVFHGQITYASLLWESVDWNLFDYAGVDHYRVERIKEQYAEMLKPAFEYGKPVVVTEFGMPTYQGAEINGAGLGGNIIDRKSQALHYALPLLGKLIRPKLTDGNHIRDEGVQARELVD